jgi:palmitoyltransferase
MNLAVGNDALIILCSLFFLIDQIFFVKAYRSDPGFITKSDDTDFLELIESYEPTLLCPFCEVVRTPRSRHCNTCDKCVERFDHHCPWINNCIGKTNHCVFYFYVLFAALYIMASFTTSILCKSFIGHSINVVHIVMMI